MLSNLILCFIGLDTNHKSRFFLWKKMLAKTSNIVLYWPYQNILTHALCFHFLFILIKYLHVQRFSHIQTCTFTYISKKDQIMC